MQANITNLVQAPTGTYLRCYNLNSYVVEIYIIPHVLAESKGWKYSSITAAVRGESAQPGCLQ